MSDRDVVWSVYPPGERPPPPLPDDAGPLCKAMAALAQEMWDYADRWVQLKQVEMAIQAHQAAAQYMTASMAAYTSDI